MSTIRSSERTKDLFILLPGMGLRKFIFDNLAIDGEIMALDHIEPLLSEDLTSYASRIVNPTMVKGRRVYVVGHSFGGVLAQELANIIDVAGVILVSTITNVDEVPLSLNIVKRLHMYQLIRGSMVANFCAQWGRWYSYQSQNGRSQIIDSLGSYSSSYYRWAIDRILSWEGCHVEVPTLRLHGSHDRTFPLKYITDAEIVPRGTHNMLYYRGIEISKRVRAFVDDVKRGT